MPDAAFPEALEACSLQMQLNMQPFRHRHRQVFATNLEHQIQF